MMVLENIAGVGGVLGMISEPGAIDDRRSTARDQRTIGRTELFGPARPVLVPEIVRVSKIAEFTRFLFGTASNPRHVYAFRRQGERRGWGGILRRAHDPRPS